MIFNRESAVLVVGMRGHGKTYWIKQHLKKFPHGIAYIYDYNQNDYQEFEPCQNIWNNRTSTKDEFDEFIDIPYAKGNCFVVMEEADQYLKVSGSETMRHFIGTARNRGIGFICNTKRPFGINPDFRTAFDTVIVFHTNDPEDIIYLEKWAGSSLSQISKLEKREFIEINMVNKEISEVKVL